MSTIVSTTRNFLICCNPTSDSVKRPNPELDDMRYNVLSRNNLEIWPGYLATTRLVNDGIFLNVDTVEACSSLELHVFVKGEVIPAAMHLL